MNKINEEENAFYQPFLLLQIGGLGCAAALQINRYNGDKFSVIS